MSDGKAIKQIKRAKYEKKQDLIRKNKLKQSEQESFILKHAHFCHFLEEDLATIQRNLRIRNDNGCCNDEANHETLLLSKLIEPYLDLKNKKINYDDTKDKRNCDNDSSPSGTCTSSRRLFIAEGAETVRVLIRQSSYPDGIKLRSIMVKPATFWDQPVRLLDDVIDAAKKSTRSTSASDDRIIENLAAARPKGSKVYCIQYLHIYYTRMRRFLTKQIVGYFQLFFGDRRCRSSMYTKCNAVSYTCW